MKKVLFVLALTVATPLAAQERVELKTSVRGNSEAPKALYIVPWKGLSPVDMVDLEAETLHAEELEPVDRDAFQYEVELYKRTRASDK